MGLGGRILNKFLGHSCCISLWIRIQAIISGTTDLSHPNRSINGWHRSERLTYEWTVKRLPMLCLISSCLGCFKPGTAKQISELQSNCTAAWRGASVDSEADAIECWIYYFWYKNTTSVEWLWLTSGINVELKAHLKIRNCQLATTTASASAVTAPVSAEHSSIASEPRNHHLSIMQLPDSVAIKTNQPNQPASQSISQSFSFRTRDARPDNTCFRVKPFCISSQLKIGWWSGVNHRNSMGRY